MSWQPPTRTSILHLDRLENYWQNFTLHLLKIMYTQALSRANKAVLFSLIFSEINLLFPGILFSLFRFSRGCSKVNSWNNRTQLLHYFKFCIEINNNKMCIKFANSPPRVALSRCQGWRNINFQITLLVHACKINNKLPFAFS